MKKNNFVLAVIPLFLAACGSHTSGTTGRVGVGASVSGDRSTSVSKSISTDDRTSKDISIPAQAVITTALFNGDVEQRGAKILKQAYKFGDSARHAGLLEETYERAKGSQIIEGKMSDAKLRELDVKLADLVKNGAGKDVILARWSDVFKRESYKNRLSVCAMNKIGVDRYVNISSRHADEYLREIATDCQFANTIYTELAAQAGSSIMDNPDTAAGEVLMEWKELPFDKLDIAYQMAAKSNAGNDWQFDGTGKGFRFRTTSGVYENTGNGFSISSFGVAIFGNGKLSGRDVSFKVASAIGTRISKDGGVSKRGGAQSGVDIGGGAQAR